VLAKLRPRSAYDVLAALAFFIAVSTGSAYAINEWTGANIVDESLTGADVQGKAVAGTTPAVNGSLTTHDIAGQQANSASGTPFIDGTLTQWDIKNSSVTGGDLAGNTVGAADIATDAVGAPELAAAAVGGGELKFLNVVGLGTSVPPGGGVGQVVQTCPNGVRIGGGANFDFPSGDISESRPGPNQSWVAEGQNNGNLPQDLSAWVICLIP
jgi:hypothetical protein